MDPPGPLSILLRTDQYAAVPASVPPATLRVPLSDIRTLVGHGGLIDERYATLYASHDNIT